MKVNNEALIKEARQSQKRALKSAMIEHYVGGMLKLIPFERYEMQYFSAINVKLPLTNGQKIARLRTLPDVFQQREKWNKNCVVQFCFKDEAIIKSLADEITKEFYEEYGSLSYDPHISAFEVEA